MERRSRAGSVLSDEQAQEVERLLSPEAETGGHPAPPARTSSTDDSSSEAALEKLDSLVSTNTGSKQEVVEVEATSDTESAESFDLVQPSAGQVSSASLMLKYQISTHVVSNSHM